MIVELLEVDKEGLVVLLLFFTVMKEKEKFFDFSSE